MPLGECEAIEAIASRLPAIVIGDLLGYPRDQWERVRHWSEQVMLLAGQTSPDGPPHAPDPGLGPVITEFIEITSELIEQRRADPQDDLISVVGLPGLEHQEGPGRDDPRPQRRRRDDPHGDRNDDP